ncbi:putative uncharacterized protein C8orf44 [Plecturocebus cupreus]
MLSIRRAELKSGHWGLVPALSLDKLCFSLSEPWLTRLGRYNGNAPTETSSKSLKLATVQVSPENGHCSHLLGISFPRVPKGERVQLGLYAIPSSSSQHRAPVLIVPSRSASPRAHGLACVLFFACVSSSEGFPDTTPCYIAPHRATMSLSSEKISSIHSLAFQPSPCRRMGALEGGEGSCSLMGRELSPQHTAECLAQRLGRLRQEDRLSPKVQGQSGQYSETLSVQKNRKISQVWWCAPVVPATQEAEVMGRLTLSLNRRITTVDRKEYTQTFGKKWSSSPILEKFRSFFCFLVLISQDFWGFNVVQREQKVNPALHMEKTLEKDAKTGPQPFFQNEGPKCVKETWNIYLLEDGEDDFQQFWDSKTTSGQAQWLTPVIPTHWEAEAGRSLEPKSLRQAWTIWWNPISTKKYKNWLSMVSCTCGPSHSGG